MGCQASQIEEEVNILSRSKIPTHVATKSARVVNHRVEQPLESTSSVREDKSFWAHGVDGLALNDVYKAVDKDQFVGQGQFGYVYRMVHRQKRTFVAVKMTKPTQLDYRRSGKMTSYHDVSEMCQEVRTLLKIRGGHHVLQLMEFFWEAKTDRLELVMELLHMNLREWLVQQSQLTENQVRGIARSVLSGLDFLNRCNIVHRDIKEDNIMFRRAGDVESLAIVDFGFARELQRNEKVVDICGSRGFIAPEIYLGEPYGTEVDMFSFGVTLFRILTADKPWPDGPTKAIREATVQLRYRIDKYRWSTISRPPKDLIRQCLSYATERISPRGALNHSFVTGNSDSRLQVDGSSFFPAGSQAREISQAIIEEPGSRATEATLDGRFWLDGALEAPIRKLVDRGVICTRIVGRDQGFIMLEEPWTGNEKTLPEFVAILPRYTEFECRNIFRQIVLGVQAIHNAGLAHRNLNPSNFIAHFGVEDGCKICTKGIQFVQASTGFRSIAGRIGPGKRRNFDWYAFVAPEINTEFAHDSRVDLFSLGSLLYNLLCGIGPFTGSPSSIVANKNSGTVSFTVVQPSAYAQALVKGLLTPEPEDRLSVDDVLHHAWMLQPKLDLLSHDLQIAHSIFQDYRRRPTQ